MKLSVGTRSELRLRADTKEHRLIAAQFSSQRWRFDNQMTGAVQCCFCGIWVDVIRHENEDGEVQSWTSALIGQLMGHFDNSCPNIRSKERVSAGVAFCGHSEGVYL